MDIIEFYTYSSFFSNMLFTHHSLINLFKQLSPQNLVVSKADMAFAFFYFFIHEYFPNTYYVPATLIASEDTKIRKRVCDNPCGIRSPVEEIDINQVN